MNSTASKVSVAGRFPSLTALQERHAELVKDVGTDLLSPGNSGRIADFVQSGRATGAILDGKEDRALAQSLINFWTARLASAARTAGRTGTGIKLDVPEFDDTLLAEFETDTFIQVAEAADNWHKNLSTPDQILARRLLLRLMHLRDDDKEFEVRTSTPALFEELEPRERAESLLAELAKLGVVRRTRNPSGNEEFVLRSAELLKRWKRLQDWMEERKEFRKKATAWAEQTSEQPAYHPDRSFMRRAGMAFSVAVHNTGARIEAGWRKLLVNLHLGSVTEELLSNDEYEEAATYRDKNAAEHRLIYLKRELERERRERGQVRAAAFAVTAMIFATLSGVAIWNWVAQIAATGEAEIQTRKAKKQEDIAKENEKAATMARTNEAQQREEAVQARNQAKQAEKKANLEIASWQLNRGAELDLRDRDTSGAFLWYAAGWSKYSAASSEAEKLLHNASHLLRLGVTQRQLPVLSGMAYQARVPMDGRIPTTVAHSEDGEFAITAGIEEHEEGKGSSLVVKSWRADSTWQADSLEGKGKPQELLALPLGEPKPDRGLRVFLSPDGRFAVIALSWEKESILYPLTIEVDKNPDHATAITTIAGSFVEAGISPDGRYFAMVSKPVPPDEKSKSLMVESEVKVWELDKWKPLPLSEPKQNGTLGGITFSPPRGVPATAKVPRRLAVVLGSDSPVPEIVCLEWSLDNIDPKEPKPYRVRPEQLPSSPPGDDTKIAAYGPGEQNQLFVARGRQKDYHRAAWLFNTQPTEDSAPRPFDLWNHRGPITHASFSPSGDRLATASDDGGIVLWDLLRARKNARIEVPSQPVEGHQKQVFDVEFSSDGQYLMTASRDKTAMIWDVSSGKPAHPPLRHSGSVGKASFTRGGRRVVTVSESAMYRWELPWAQSRPLYIGVPSNDARWSVMMESLDREGRVLVAGGLRAVATGGESRGSSADAVKGWARAWDTATGNPLTPELLQEEPIRHVSVSPRNPFLVCTTSNSGTVRLWNEKGEMTSEERPCDDKAIFTAFGDDGLRLRLLVLGRQSQDTMAGSATLRLHTISPNGELSPDLQTPYDGPLTAAVFSPKCERVLAYSGDAGDGRGLAVVWDLANSKRQSLEQPGARLAHREAITHAIFSKNGERLITSSRDDTATVWVKDGSEWKREELVARKDPEHGIALHTLEQTFARHTADINFASFDADGNRVVTASADGRAIVWERVEKEKRYRPIVQLKPGAGVNRAVFINNRSVLTTSTDNVVRVWDTESRRVIATQHHSRSISHMSWRPVQGKPELGQVISIERDRGYQGYEERGFDSQQGPSLRARSAQFAVTHWPLRPADEKSLQEVMTVAKLTAARRVSPIDSLDMDSIPVDEAFRLWQESGPRGSAATSPADLSDWHEREATACEYADPPNWSGAMWHWDQLLDERGLTEQRRQILLERRTRVHVKLVQWVQDNEARSAIEEALDRASEQIQLRKWDEAAKAYQAIIKLDSKNSSHRLRLAAIYLQLSPPEKEVQRERLEQASLCLSEAVKDFPQQSLVWLRLAVVQQKAGKNNEYETTRNRMYEAFPNPTTEAANNVAWAAAFAKDTREGAERAVKLAAKAVATSPRNATYLNTYGAVLFRAGKSKEAIDQLELATKERGFIYLTADQKAYSNAFDMLFTAMAQKTLEQPEKARKALDSAVETIKNFEFTQQAENPTLSLTRVWNRLEFEVLRREAESLINPKKAKE